MALDQLLAAVLIFIMLVNAILFAAILFRGRLPFRSRRGRETGDASDGGAGRPRRRVVVASAGGSAAGVPGAAPPPTDLPFWASTRPAASSSRPLGDALPKDLADFLSKPAELDSARATAARAPEPEPHRPETAVAGADESEPPPREDLPPSRPARDHEEPHAAQRAAPDGELPPTILARLPAGPRGGPSLTLDDLTGLEGPEAWSRILEIENARLLRYRRPVTVVIADLEGMRRLAERLGDEPVERLLPVVGDAFRKEARGSDWVARVGEGRFAILLAETDEIQAINYVERVRLSCEPWLSSAAVPMRLAIGWSSPPASGDLEFAVRRAEERMHADRRQPAKTNAQARAMTARVMAWPGGHGLPDLTTASDATAAGGALSGAISAVPIPPPAFPAGPAGNDGAGGLGPAAAEMQGGAGADQSRAEDGGVDHADERHHGRRRSRDEAPGTQPAT